MMTDKRQKSGENSSEERTEFFSVGAPLHAVRAGYVARRADDELFETVMAGGNALVVAPDRSGKSSLIAAVSARLQSNGYKVAVIDLAQISERDGGTDAGRWYYNIAYRLLRQLRLKTDLQSWWQDKSMLSNRQRLVEFYIEVVLRNIQEPIAVFIDEIQCIEDLSFGEDLLISIRAAHNSRTTDPELERLSFVLLGECDPQSLVSHEGLSPFTISRKILLNDFSRKDLEIFRAELNLPLDQADVALDRIWYWTNGQPYLSQKLARSVAREGPSGDVEEQVDRLAQQQLAGRSAINNEPHLSHIHSVVAKDRKASEGLLSLYGKMRKGVSVIFDPDSALQRRLLAVGLVKIDAEGNLEPRNRVYESVFTARWANENLPLHWRGPLIAIALVIVMIAVPFWYTQLLPVPYVRVLSSPDTDIVTVTSAYENLRSFPLHKKAADNFYVNNLKMKAGVARDGREINRLALYANRMPDGEGVAASLIAGFWDRTLSAALRQEDRDGALLASLESLIVSSPENRRAAANLIGHDYPKLIGAVPATTAEQVVYDAENNLLSFITGATVAQWSLSGTDVQSRAAWTLSALDISPLLRRQVIEQAGTVRQASLNLSVSHSRLRDLRLKVIAPSGRVVDLEFEQQSSLQGETIRFDQRLLSDLVGEEISGTWSLSVRDESSTVLGSLAGWALSINGRVYADLPERELDIPDPVARESNDLWFSSSGRYAIAREMHSDSARLWDLLYAQPARTIPVPADEQVLGLSENADYIITATQSSVYLWSTNSGRRSDGISMDSRELSLSDDGTSIISLQRGDEESVVELWSIADATRVAQLTIAGSPALFASSTDGQYIASADYDRTVRLWDLRNEQQSAQFDLPLQATSVDVAPDGRSIGIIHGDKGLSLWSSSDPTVPIVLEQGRGDWGLAFSPSGTSVIAGNSSDGFQTYRSSDGAIVGPALGTDIAYGDTALLAFSQNEEIIVTAGLGSSARFWNAPNPLSVARRRDGGHSLWRDSGDSVSAIAEGGQRLAIGDRDGHVHVLTTSAFEAELAAARDEISFLGHQTTVSALRFSRDGQLVASASIDGEVRIWDATTGLPRAFRSGGASGAVTELAFSPTGKRLAVIAGQNVWILNTDDGVVVADLDVGEHHPSIAFADDETLYMASENGALRAMSADRTASWSVRTVWTSDKPLIQVAISPVQQHLVVVDESNLASLIILKDGRVGSSVVQLANDVREILFSPSETRVLFRTPRWIHQVSVSQSGLVWLDALRTPKGFSGSNFALDFASDGQPQTDPLGGQLVLLTRDTGSVEVAEFEFSGQNGPMLIGSQQDLLKDWSRKLGASLEEE